MDNPCNFFLTFAAQSLFLKTWTATMLLCDAFPHFTTAAVTRQLFLLHPSASRCVYPSSNTRLFGQESRSNLFPDCPWFEFVYRQPWAAQSSGNVLWETMVVLTNQTPLFQIKHSIHAASLVGLSKQAFTDASNTLQGLLPNVDLGMFGCLNPGVWIDDNVMSLFIDCLRRGMPVPSSPESG